MPHSLDYDWYRYYISKCDYQDDAFEYLDEAADDPTIDLDDFASLTLLVQDLTKEGKLV